MKEKKSSGATEKALQKKGNSCSRHEAMIHIFGNERRKRNQNGSSRWW